MALVLVRDVAPTRSVAAVDQGDAQRPEWIDAPRPDRTQVLPLVAEVEHVGELLAGLQPTQARATVIEQMPGVVIVVAEEAQAVFKTGRQAARTGSAMEAALAEKPSARVNSCR
jgi:hypothetical protein